MYMCSRCEEEIISTVCNDVKVLSTKSTNKARSYCANNYSGVLQIHKPTHKSTYLFKGILKLTSNI